jgi:hypothetical protein
MINNNLIAIFLNYVILILDEIAFDGIRKYKLITLFILRLSLLFV